LTRKEGGKHTVLELIGGFVPRFRYAPRCLGLTLFPYHSVITLNAASPFDFAFAVHHEIMHIALPQKLGHWELYRRFDLLAKLLLEIVGEQGDDPHAFVWRAQEIWARLRTLDEDGLLLEEAIALLPLLADDLGARLWEFWQTDPMFVELRSHFPPSLQEESSESEFLQRAKLTREALGSSSGSVDSNRRSAWPQLDLHRDAYQLLGQVSRKLGNNQTVIQEMLHAANAVPLEGTGVLCPSPETFREVWSKRNGIGSRDGRFRLLASDPKDFVWALVRTFGFFSVEREYPTFEELLAWLRIPKPYLQVLRERCELRSSGGASAPVKTRGLDLWGSRVAARLCGGGQLMCMSLIPDTLEEHDVEPFLDDQGFLTGCYSRLLRYMEAMRRSPNSQEDLIGLNLLSLLGRERQAEGRQRELDPRWKLVDVGLDMHFLEDLGRRVEGGPTQYMALRFWASVFSFRDAAQHVELSTPVKEVQQRTLRRIEALDRKLIDREKELGLTGNDEENSEQPATE